MSSSKVLDLWAEKDLPSTRRDLSYCYTYVPPTKHIVPQPPAAFHATKRRYSMAPHLEPFERKTSPISITYFCTNGLGTPRSRCCLGEGRCPGDREQMEMGPGFLPGHHLDRRFASRTRRGGSGLRLAVTQWLNRPPLPPRHEQGGFRRRGLRHLPGTSRYCYTPSGGTHEITRR